MKFTDGFWGLRHGVDAHYASHVSLAEPSPGGIRVLAPTRAQRQRGDTLNTPVLSVTVTAPIRNVLKIRIEHHAGGADPVRFKTASDAVQPEVNIDAVSASVRSGDLEARIRLGAGWELTFTARNAELTSSRKKAVAWMRTSADADVDTGVPGLRRTAPASYIHEQLDLGIGGLVYGLGEQFGPLVKNGQSVQAWNADGGTASDQAYKNVPFYLTNRGYGVLVNDPGHVSFEVASEAVERVQFSVEGEALEYFVIHGESPAAILERYTALTGRPPEVPAWSYGLWLSTSFTTSYDEATVTEFIDGMLQRDIPLGVFHFDCFWMREFHWSDFEWDPAVFPDPVGMLARLHEKELRICVWINPYIAQFSAMFAEGAEHGYLVCRPDGSVWQWDMWQPGMALVDFTNPDATAWFQERLRRLIAEGVDTFKTDFGERIPTDVVWADGSDPKRMHNQYTALYNAAVRDVLMEERGEAVLFARSATAGGQQMPVHWGGDSTSTFASMAETLRGGLSLALTGFAYWSHDIGGFEGTPDAAVFKRWIAFGLLSSHSRLHGSESYRVPWLTGEADDDPEGAVSVTRHFTKLKNRLAPYLISAGAIAARTGLPILRPMPLEFPDDPATAYLDRQYLLGPDLLVAPVFTAAGDVEFYLPAGTWVRFTDGAVVEGGRWVREHHSFKSLPLYIRPGGVVPLGSRADRPDSDHLDGLTLVLGSAPGDGASRTVTVDSSRGPVDFTVAWASGTITATSELQSGWSLGLPGSSPVRAEHGCAVLQ